MEHLTKHVLMNLCPQCNHPNEEDGGLAALSGVGPVNCHTPRIGGNWPKESPRRTAGLQDAQGYRMGPS